MTEFSELPEDSRMDAFIDEADIIGKTIVRVQWTPDADLENMGWGRRGVELVLDDGSIIVVQQDDEGNGPGSAIVCRENECFYLPVF